MKWEELKQKLGSRKFWALVAIFVPSLLIYTGVINTDKAGELSSLIIAGGACVAYMFAESAVDVARAISSDKEVENDGESNES